MTKRDNSSLNIAGKLAEIFIDSKLTVLLILASLIFGVMALLFTPRTYNPEIVVPVVNIAISRPGSDTQEMLKQVVRPLEGIMASMPGVDHTYGVATDDKALVTVRFKVNEDEENSFVKVYKQISSNIIRMPFGTYPPLVQAVSLYDVPIVTITLSGKNYDQMQLHAFANNVLEQLRRLPNVGKSWIAGSSPTALKIWIDSDKLAVRHIPIQNIRGALLSGNVAMSVGALDSNTLGTPLRIDASLSNPEDVGNTIVGIYDAKPVYLRDVAKIEKASENEKIVSYFAFGKAALSDSKQNLSEDATIDQNSKLQPAVTIALARQKGSNGVDVANAVLDRLKIIEKKSLPNDLNVTVTRNYGADANEAVNTLTDHLGIAILSVIAILLLFLGWRESSIVTISIPIILFLTLGMGWVTGQTINRITLFALILSLGLLVDDSIVVIENIHRHMLHEPWNDFKKMIIVAANEIGRPTIIATFTVMLALLPMGFVSGMMGPFMAPIPFNTLIAMFISLIIAYTVVPYLSYYWLKNKAHKLEKITISAPARKSFLKRLYISLFQPLMDSQRRRHLFYGVVGILLVLAMFQPVWQFIRPSGTNGPLSLMGVELKMLPDDNVNTFLVEINTPTGTAIVATHEVTKDIAKILDKNNYVKNYQIFLGQAAPEDFAAMARGDAMQSGEHYAQIRVNLTDKHDRSVGSHKIAQEFYKSLAGVRNKYQGVRIKLFETPPGPPVRSQMETALYGPNYSALQNLAEEIGSKIYPEIYGMINIDTSVTQNLSEYRILIDRNQAVLSGLSPENLSHEISAYFAGVYIGAIHGTDGSEPQNIILRLPKVARENPEALGNIYLLNRQSQLVPLNKVATLKYGLQTKPIYTRDQYPVVYIGGEVLSSSPVYAVITASEKLKEISLPDGSSLEVEGLSFNEAIPDDTANIKVSWLGEMRLTLDVFRDLGAAFIVALLLIYLLLTGFYRSFSIPIIIMGAIPLTIIGVFPGHWIMNQPFTATSMIGVIALAGIVVRNSLLLIDFILERRKQGDGLEGAVVNAAVVRLSPILLTALAIILGSSVMISDPVFGGLAVSLIFGSFASTLLTLFAIPLVYYGWVRDRG